MDSSASSVISSSSLSELGGSNVDSSSWQKQQNVPPQFIWPKEDLVEAQQELNEPPVDLEGFLKGDGVATQEAARRIRDACLKHGLFQVINHGVDSSLLSAAYEETKKFFKLPISQKTRAERVPGSMCGYSNAHIERYSAKLPWNETLSFDFHENSKEPIVANFFKSSFGEDFEQIGWIYQKYCEAMKGLTLAIMELLAISLGVDRLYYKRIFQDCCAITRCNYYPRCPEAGLTLGTGPHTDPISITILQQDDVAGLDVFSNNKWLSVQPHPKALVINIGDTFTAFSNGIYKSCLHRAVVNTKKDRISMVFFVSPRDDKVVRPPSDLISSQGRMYPDFTWSDFFAFTKNHYRVDGNTFDNFIKWFESSKSPKPQVP